ncbi:hypothetical protein HDU76_007260 [Blyttiomyces sp. JEL0837]|nr:hypothetical protein HDU76_007260 [Blyttiomyces sp. JEL0837]
MDKEYRPPSRNGTVNDRDHPASARMFPGARESPLVRQASNSSANFYNPPQPPQPHSASTSHGPNQEPINYPSVVQTYEGGGTPGILSRSGSLAGSELGWKGGDSASEINVPTGGGVSKNVRELHGRSFALHTAPRRSSLTRLDKRGTLQAAQFINDTSFGGKNHFPLIREETSIGRKDDNHIVLLDGKVSKYHAIVQRKENGVIILTLDDVQSNPRYYIKDRNSSNGVRINNALIDPDRFYKLNDGDKVLIGSINVTFRDECHDTEERESAEKEVDENVKLVTILPSEKRYEETNTGNLGTHYVKLREGKANEGKEILLSSTILRKVFDSRVSLVTRDAYEDPMLGKAASVKYGQIRSVICVPLIAHNKVHGILHLDSRDRINSSFSSKDLSLVKAISNQTATAIENMLLIKEVEQKARITEQLSRFLAPHVVDKMAQRNLISSSGRELVGTIIFVDIRGFTNFSEKVGPAEVVNLLNDYFERLVRIVFKYEGVVDKYIGDALMAVFGTLEEEKDAEYRSVAAALEFKTTIKEMNEDRVRRGKEAISIGVGVNTGELVAGFIGSIQRLEYTCIGDTVNTSSRICDMAKQDQVYISETTYEAIKDYVTVEPVGYRQFKGKRKEVMIYEALAIKPKT